MTKDGGQAFPSEKPVMINSKQVQGALERVGTEYISGMTLRDYFMAHCPDVPSWYRNKINPHRHDYDSEVDYVRVFFSWRTYYADAMILERNKL